MDFRKSYSTVCSLLLRFNLFQLPTLQHSNWFHYLPLNSVCVGGLFHVRLEAKIKETTLSARKSSDPKDIFQEQGLVCPIFKCLVPHLGLSNDHK